MSQKAICCCQPIRKSLVWAFLPFLLLIVSGCAGTISYGINVRYEPVKAVPAADALAKKPVLTVANLNEGRSIDDPLKVGYVLKSDGRRIFVVPGNAKPTEAVAAGIRDYFYKGGYSVSGLRPAWDLREETIGGGWGDIVVGGVINKLSVVCDDSQTLSPVKTYSTVVNLGVVVADVATKKILYKTSAEGSASLTDVTLSVDKLQNQLNGVLTEVIEKLFAGGEFREQIKKAVKR